MSMGNFFTFHNVSINTFLNSSPFRRITTLHSTMFLLILVKVLLVKSVTHFTFHNVSINTTPPKCCAIN